MTSLQFSPLFFLIYCAIETGRFLQRLLSFVFLFSALQTASRFNGEKKWKISAGVDFNLHLHEYFSPYFSIVLVILNISDGTSTHLYIKKYSINHSRIPTLLGGSTRVSRSVTRQDGLIWVGSCGHVSTYCRLTIEGLTL